MDNFYDFIMAQDNDKVINQLCWESCAVGEYYEYLTGGTLTGFYHYKQDTWPSVFSGKIYEFDPELASGIIYYGELKELLAVSDRGELFVS